MRERSRRHVPAKVQKPKVSLTVTLKYNKPGRACLQEQNEGVCERPENADLFWIFTNEYAALTPMEMSGKTNERLLVSQRDPEI